MEVDAYGDVAQRERCAPETGWNTSWRYRLPFQRIAPQKTPPLGCPSPVALGQVNMIEHKLYLLTADNTYSDLRLANVVGHLLCPVGVVCMLLRCHFI
jgi:hypothetical protein